MIFHKGLTLNPNLVMFNFECLMFNGFSQGNNIKF